MNTLIWPAVNLVILVGFVVYKTKHPFRVFMVTRHKSIFDGLNKSKLHAAAVAQKKKDIEAKLANLDAEKVEIANEWIERQIQQVAAVRESSARTVAQMHHEAKQNKHALEISLRADMLRNFKRNVIVQAEAKIAHALNSGTHGKINHNFIEEVSTGASAK
jgi:F0F1-type ATP synthase membrane subunit b/b'